MTARRVVAALDVTMVSGSGYAPDGKPTSAEGGAAAPDGARDELIRTALLCNDARLVERDGRLVWRIVFVSCSASSASSSMP